MTLRIKRKKGVNALNIGIKVGITVVSLYAGGYLIITIGDTLNATASAFYKGLSLIGWTLTDNVDGTNAKCSTYGWSTGTVDNCITDTSGSGILAIIGIIVIAMLVFEFVDIRM